MKKLLCLALAAMLCLALAACAVAEGNWKIAILTGTTSQGEEEFRAAERAQKADPEHIVTDTYPDNFMAETETTISKLIAFASDPDVKAIVMCQAVPGAKAAFDKIRAMGRDDMLLIAGVPQEDPAVITAAADFVLYTDEPKQGDTIMETCAKWGVDVFVHYSFPRHLAMETIAARKALLEENAAALGIQYVEATAPDPTGDAGVAGAQQFILEDVPKMVEKYGKETAFFTTNCAMQVPLIKAVYDAGAYYVQPCCPSPYHGFPSAFGIESPEDLVGGLEATIAAEKKYVADAGLTGHFSTWAVPASIANTVAGTEYAFLWMAGLIGDCDADAMSALLTDYCGAEAALTPFVDPGTGEVTDNYLVYQLGYLDL